MGKPGNDHHHGASKLPSSAISKLETSITLKVLIHCEGCKRKVKRIIKCVDGVESVTIEPENGKVIVSGKGVDAKDVLQNLHKAGKHAEIWHFGGAGKAPSHMSLPTNLNRPTNNNNHNSNANNVKAVGWDPKLNVEDKKGFNTKGRGNDGNNFNASSGANTNFSHGKSKGGDQMVELGNLVPQKPPNFPNGGSYASGGHFDKPSFPSNNVAILSRNVAPMPSVYYGETSQSGARERR
ncbi:hypothetical protein GOP47_0002574 [Adiantum capillus-veneris]|uniref:HMA domain-containing protein n=1 Tax=Adiantum capillus-veneris TaxID=13818 RepID=A0A9D4VAC2_ADICA|nr:hypothetical protein GOP47_0002574 [Adiantum capillus-veneris]